MARFDLTDGDDAFAGGADDDEFIGPPGGADTLSGGGGNDVFNISASGGVQGGTINGGLGVDTVIAGRLGTAAFSGVEILNTVYGFLSDASVDQLNAFQTIDASAEPSGQISITLSATVGGAIDFGTRISAGHGVYLNTSAATSGVNATGTSRDDTFIGSAFDDNFIGGAGNDTYFINQPGDGVVEAPGGGRDLIVATFSRSLAATPDVEDLTFTESGDYVGTGNALDNVITGYYGADTLDGGAGADTLIGGQGNDTYINPAYGEIVEIAGQGFDRVISDASFSIWTLPGIERLELTGAVPGFLRGNNNVNSLIGNSGSNTMHGYNGADTILGLGGRDTIVGGMGRDTIAPGLERDTVKWDAVAESTGVNRDSVSEFVFTSGGPYEMLDFHVVPTQVRQTITTGMLREGNFDQDLALAVNAANLGAGQAVLFDPNAGDLDIAGHVYLIVDANNQAGYQAGQDYVVQFTSTYGTLTLANFI